MARKIVARTGFTAANDATDLNQVGTIMDDATTGKSYRYVQVEDMALAANDVVSFADATGKEVTQDRAAGSSISHDFAGVAVNTLTDAYYGWVQIKGLATCRVLQNTAVLAGARVMLHATDDGGVATLATQTTSSVDKSFGVALANDTATTSADGTVAVMIDL
jgi:hypothetical protein